MEKDMNKNSTKNVLRNICISTVILFLGIILIFKSIKLEPEKKELLYSCLNYCFQKIHFH